MVEAAIDLRYMSLNPQPLVTKWCVYEDAMRFLYWCDRDEALRPPDYGACEKNVLDRLKLLDRHSPKKSGRPWKAKDLTRDWDQSNLQSRDAISAKELEGAASQQLYDIYKLLCENAHGTTSTLRDFIARTQTGRFQPVRSLPGRKAVFSPAIALVALSIGLQAAARCGALLDLDSVGPDASSLGELPDLVQAAANDFGTPEMGL